MALLIDIGLCSQNFSASRRCATKGVGARCRGRNDKTVGLAADGLWMPFA